MDAVRIDLWLWAARFFKTRALAKKACDLGRVESNGHPAKAAREVHVGDRLRIVSDSGEFHVEVLALSDIRGPAPVAQALYVEPEESRAARQKAAEERRALHQFEPIPTRRPSKRDRRRIIHFRSGPER
jgi:ribosome-associated heat shock protein Hsp15